MKKLFLIALFLLLLPSSALAAIGFDAASSTSAYGAGNQTLSFTPTNAATMIVVGINNGNNTGDTVTNVTWNGVSMTQLGKVQSSGGAPYDFWSYLYAMATTSDGLARNIVTTGTINATVKYLSYRGTAATVPTNIVTTSVNNVSTTTISSTINIANATSWIIGTGDQNEGSPNTWQDGITTERVTDGGARQIGDSNGTVTTGNHNVRWGGFTSPHWTLITAELEAAAGGGTTVSDFGVSSAFWW